jgi:hypothetical protein
VTTAGHGGYTVYTCHCSVPYVGARKEGTPACCETCGYMTPEQLASILHTSPRILKKLTDIETRAVDYENDLRNLQAEVEKVRRARLCRGHYDGPNDEDYHEDGCVICVRNRLDKITALMGEIDDSERRIGPYLTAARIRNRLEDILILDPDYDD